MKYVLILWLMGANGLDKQEIYMTYTECHTLEKAFRAMAPRKNQSERTQIRQIYFHGSDKDFIAFESCVELKPELLVD